MSDAPPIMKLTWRVVGFFIAIEAFFTALVIYGAFLVCGAFAAPEPQQPAPPLTAEKAIRKLSGVQADLFGFKDRGYLREGAFADVFVFDLDTVGPGPVRRVRDFPANTERLTADAPTGVHHMFVNGTAIRRDGVSMAATTDPRPGRMAKPSPR